VTQIYTNSGRQSSEPYVLFGVSSGAKPGYGLWMPKHPQNFEKPLVKINFHHINRLNLQIYKREAPPLICASFAPEYHMWRLALRCCGVGF
jgi:hypothetical protein